MSVIVGIGTATPACSVGQGQAARLIASLCGAAGETRRFVEVVHRRSGIERRGSVVVTRETAEDEPIAQALYPTESAGRGPSTEARMAAYALHAGTLAAEAASRAMADAGITASEVTHLVTASCTGFGAPGVDVDLIERLGLDRRVRRTHVGFMGCHAAINAIRVADAIVGAEEARGRARPIVLVVCVELCSLHLQCGEEGARPDQAVANALFADGAGAVVVRAGENGLAVVESESVALPHCRGAMSWSIGDHGFRMTLAESVPELVRGSLRPWLTEWLGRAGIEPRELAGLRWAVHPGGPRVLDAVAEAVGLEPEAMEPSRGVLCEHGNMSSPTVLFILERLRRRGLRPAGESEPGERAVMLAFGPGFTVEGMLLEAR